MIKLNLQPPFPKKLLKDDWTDLPCGGSVFCEDGYMSEICNNCHPWLTVDRVILDLECYQKYDIYCDHATEWEIVNENIGLAVAEVEFNTSQ